MLSKTCSTLNIFLICVFYFTFTLTNCSNVSNTESTTTTVTSITTVETETSSTATVSVTTVSTTTVSTTTVSTSTTTISTTTVSTTTSSTTSSTSSTTTTTLPEYKKSIQIVSSGDEFIMGDGTYGPDATQALSYNYNISKYEVNNLWYSEFISDGGYSNTNYWTQHALEWIDTCTGGTGIPCYGMDKNNPLPEYWSDPGYNGTNQPIVGISWYEAIAFCNWLSDKAGVDRAYDSSGRITNLHTGYRLLTEVEWEYAGAKGASGETERRYANGSTWACNNFNNNVSPCSSVKTDDIDSRPIGNTPQGVFNMGGNAYEWVSDNFKSDISVISKIDRTYFTNDNTSSKMILRGGCFSSSIEGSMRMAYRYGDFPFARHMYVGFRIVVP